MLKRYHHIVGGVFRAVDALVILAAWLIAYWARFYAPFLEVTRGLPPFRTYVALSPLVIALWMTVLSSVGAYQGRRMLRRTQEAQVLLRGHGAAMLLFIAITYLFSEYKYSRGVMLMFAVLGGFGLVTLRLAVRNFLRNLRRKGYNLRHIIAVGEGPAVETLLQRLTKYPELGFRVMGVVLHENSTLGADGSVYGRPLLGRFKDLHAILQKHPADQIVIALPRSQYGELDELLHLLRDEVIDLKLIPDVHEYVTLGCEIEDFDGLPVVNLNGSPLEGWGGIAKRFTDIVLSAAALIILSPVLLLLAIAVRLSSPGPIFYAQERMGLDGRTFRMFKFRSMRQDAEEQSGAVWAKPGDSRKTALGSLLRATSLDELPQFWNVLRGDMSLVGPRPERPVFVHQFRHQIPHYMLRHKVKAGITGWAQINGWRGNTSLDRRIECDLYYIRHWSYFLDLKILVLTLWKGFISKNAY